MATDWINVPNATWYGTTNATSGTVAYWPTQVTYGGSIPGVLESPAAELTDREWLDAQISEVCGAAV